MAGTEHLFHELFESLRVLWGPLTSKKWEQQLRQGWKEKYVYCVTNSLTGFGAITNTGLTLTHRCSSRPAMRCDSSPAKTFQRNQFHSMYGTSAIQK